MSDIDIDLGVEGTDEAATDVRAVSDALGQLGTSAGAASTGVESLEGSLRSERTTLRSVRAEVGRTATAKQALARTTATASSAATEAGSRWGQLAGAVGNVGAVFGQANPVMNQAGSIIGQVGTASSALTGALGPLGVAVAVVTTAYGIYQIAAQSAAADTEALATAAAQAEQRIRSLSRAITESDALGNAMAGTAAVSDIQTRIGELDLESRALIRNSTEAERFFSIRQMDADLVIEQVERARAAGQEGLTGSSSTREAAATLITARARQAEITRQRIELTEGLTRATEALAAEEAAAAQAAALVAQGESQDGRRTASRASRASRGGGGGQEARAEASRQRARDLVDAELTRRAQAQMARDAEVHSEAMKASEERMELERLAREERDTDARKEIDDINRASAARLEAAEKLKTAHQEASAARADELRTITGEIEGQLVRVASLFTGAFKTAIKGEKAFEEALAEGGIKLLEMLGDELVAKGIGSILEGATMLVTNPPGAASKIGGGTALVAFGATLGAVSAAIPSPGGAGAPTSPVEDRPADGNDGPGELTLVINSPVQTAQTNAELARQLGRQLESETQFAVGG